MKVGKRAECGNAEDEEWAAIVFFFCPIPHFWPLAVFYEEEELIEWETFDMVVVDWGRVVAAGGAKILCKILSGMPKDNVITLVRRRSRLW